MIWIVPIAVGGGLILFAQKPVQKKMTEYFGPFMPVGPQKKETIDAQALSIARQKLIHSEGRRNDVYIDTLGYPTVGIGHKVVSKDNLHVGQVISDQRIEEFFAQDIKTAFDAARSQALDLKKYDARFIAALVEVNFQLGTGWTKKFSNTYALLKRGSVQNAINNLRASAWNKQTPVRVANFITEIQRAYA